MTLLGLVPVLSLTLAADVEPTTGGAPPPAATTASAPKADTAPARPAPRYKGTGLLATTGVLGGAALAVTITRSVLLKKNCPLEGTSTQCTYDFGSDIGLAATQWSLNLATIGFASGAGVMLGRYHGWKDATEGRERNRKAIMGAGGGVLGAGVASVGTAIALSFVLPKRCVDKELESMDGLAGDRCLLKAFPAWTMLNWAGFAMISSGSAMLAYGSAYGKSRNRHVSDLRFSPSFARNYAGFGVSGRF